MIGEMYRVHNKSIIIYIKIITDVVFIQIWHRLYGYTAKSLCYDYLIALAFTSWFLLFHHIQTTSTLHKFILVYFIGAIYSIKSFPFPHTPKSNNKLTKIKEKK